MARLDVLDSNDIRDPQLAAMLHASTGAKPCDERETAALEFAERLAIDHASIDDAFIERMRRTLTDAELVELGLITGAFIVLGRLHRAFGIAPMGPRSHAVLAGTMPPPDTPDHKP